MKGKKNRVLYLVNIPAPYRIEFFNELGKYCDLTVLFERETSEEREMSWYRNDYRNFEAVFLSGTNFRKDSALCISVGKYLKKNLFDVVVVGGYSTPTGMLAIQLLKQRKIPFILNTDGGYIKKDNKLKYFIKNYFISSASNWLSTSKQTHKYLLYYGAKKENIYPYSFTSVYRKDILKQPLDNKDKKKLKLKLNMTEDKCVISVGRFVYSKGFDVLLEAFSQLPSNYGVYIVGGEPIPEYLELIVKNNLTNVHFISFKTKEELNEYYKASDLFVLPTREDIWGLVINEAMANALPVVTTDHCVAGVEMIKDYENGFIVPINNSRILADKINEILSDEKLAFKMSQNNLRKIRLYSIENMVREHMEIFKTL